jgi:hypothetical protein
MNTGRLPFYVTMNVSEGKANGFVSTGAQARPIRVENSVVEDTALAFDIHDDTNRLVHFHLTLTSGVLGGEATAGSETWKVAVVAVGAGGGGRDRARVGRNWIYKEWERVPGWRRDFGSCGSP